MTTPLIVGVAGGSGSGKTTVVGHLLASFPDLIATISHDSFYRDASYVDKHVGGNWDHPDSLDNRLFAAQLTNLSAGQAIDCPVYDFSTYSRKPDETVRINPEPIIVIDGVLILALPELVGVLDLRVFVDTPQQIRYDRRKARDVRERGRTAESVLRQHETSVWPMHDQFVESSKDTADIVIPWIDENPAAITSLVTRIQAIRGG